MTNPTTFAGTVAVVMTLGLGLGIPLPASAQGLTLAEPESLGMSSERLERLTAAM